MEQSPIVALVKGTSRETNIKRALSMLDIDLSDKSRVLIKPNIVSYLHEHASTHPEALKAVLEFLRERYSGRIIIGEGTGFPAMVGFKKFGYIELARKYNAELVDLSDGPWVEVDVYGSKMQYSRIVADSDYRISLCVPKTHDSLRVSLSVKNLVMGSLKGEVPRGIYALIRRGQRIVYEHIPAGIRYSKYIDKIKKLVVSHASDNDRIKMHEDRWLHNWRIRILYEKFPAHLAIIDGYTGMEGDGPLIGEKVQWGIAIASQDAVAADCLAASLMGFNPLDIGYLYFCGVGLVGCAEIEDMSIVGEEFLGCKRDFKRSPTDKEQARWR